jgi:hypothetical protein
MACKENPPQKKQPHAGKIPMNVEMTKNKRMGE